MVLCRPASFVVVVLALTLGACAQNKPAPVQQSVLGASALHCDKMLVGQGGKQIAPVDGTFTLAREPFSLIYTGNEAAPGIALSATPNLNAFLDKFGRQTMWGSAGDYMAHAPDDLPLREGAEVVRNEQGRDKFAAAIGSGYTELLRKLVAANPALDTALSIPKAAGGFESRDGKQIQLVRTIGGVPLSKTQQPAIHLAYFATIERLGLDRPGDGKSLLKMNWGSCRLAFS